MKNKQQATLISEIKPVNKSDRSIIKAVIKQIKEQNFQFHPYIKTDQ